jgi:hypothetical protein
VNSTKPSSARRHTLFGKPPESLMEGTKSSGWKPSASFKTTPSPMHSICPIPSLNELGFAIWVVMGGKPVFRQLHSLNPIRVLVERGLSDFLFKYPVVVIL